MRISDWSSDVCSSDLPGLFYRLAGAISVVGGNIIDARIHTTRDGMALDNLLIQDPLGGPFAEPERLRRLVKAVEDAFANRHQMAERLSQDRKSTRLDSSH